LRSRARAINSSDAVEGSGTKAAAIRRLRATRLSPDAIAEATGSPLAQLERALETA
jgi:hypothetical protein